ncbi:proline dehydrogenase family protein [Naumannella halotolerans]|uniref:Proline dehydrogenase n=1 Tax=Naumannella halotolerans TaxID=993414 RepID=A0A4V3EMM6_9ACTN|nr:proline dehydrogenase family protein [Naumannella halotolerans]TDT29978.1 proline dehydrogenase [Naumannella halotolerans]
MAAAMLKLSNGDTVRGLASRLPLTRSLMQRLIAGDGIDEMIGAVAELAATRRLATIHHLGPRAANPRAADHTTEHHLQVLDQLRLNELTSVTELSIDIAGIGFDLPDGATEAAERLRRIARRATRLGVPVTLSGGDRRMDDVTALLGELRTDFPTIGVTVQTSLRRSEDDCAAVATPGTRVRLYAGGHREVEDLAFLNNADAELSFVRCLKAVMYSEAYPVVATHSSRLIAVAQDVAQRAGRGIDDYELSMLRGVRPAMQAKLAGLGQRVRVFVPYGPLGYEYTMRLLAQPQNRQELLRGLLERP